MGIKELLLNQLLAETGARTETYTISVYRFTEKHFTAEKDSIDYLRAYRFKEVEKNIELTGQVLEMMLSKLKMDWENDSSFAYIVYETEKSTKFYK